MTMMNKLPLRELRAFLVSQIKRHDISKLNLDDEAKYRLKAIDSFTYFQAKEWILNFPVLCDESELKTFFDSKNHHSFKTLNLENQPINKILENANAFFDFDQGFDGVDEATFIHGLLEGATLDTIKALAKSYGQEIPRRIKKQELIDIIHKRSENSIPYENLNKMSVLELETLAKDNQYFVSIELKKIEMIYYVLDYLKTLNHKGDTNEKKVMPGLIKDSKTLLIFDLKTQEFLSRKANHSSLKMILLMSLLVAMITLFSVLMWT